VTELSALNKGEQFERSGTARVAANSVFYLRLRPPAAVAKKSTEKRSADRSTFVLKFCRDFVTKS